MQSVIDEMVEQCGNKSVSDMLGDHAVETNPRKKILYEMAILSMSRIKLERGMSENELENESGNLDRMTQRVRALAQSLVSSS